MLSKSQTWAIMASLSAFVSAEVVSLFQIVPAVVPMGVSIVTSDASATTYAMACQTPLPTDEDLAMVCPVIAMMTLTQGPEYFGYRTSTVIDDLSSPLTVTMEIGCSFTDTAFATCSRGVSGIPPESMSLVEAEYNLITETSTYTMRGAELPPFAEFTVLNGSGAQPSESSGAKPSGSSGAEESSGGSGRGTAAESGGSPSPTDGGSSPESTGGASMNGWGSASIVGAGMAGALAAVMAL